MAKVQMAGAVQQERAQEDEAFVFPQGMAGFPLDTRYGFIYEGHGDIVCMQSLDNLMASFLMTPWDKERLGEPPVLSPEQRLCLQLGQGEEPMWMIVLNPFADEEWVVANLRAPVAVNDSGRRGLQCIQSDPGLELRHRWMPQPKKAA